jgi:hypothetical protein
LLEFSWLVGSPRVGQVVFEHVASKGGLLTLAKAPDVWLWLGAFNITNVEVVARPWASWLVVLVFVFHY